MPVKQDKFHGRIAGKQRECSAPGCEEAGEFRAPGGRSAGPDGPGDYRWFCLDHVRAFNSGYDWFAGMSADEILAAQHPAYGWANASRAFRPDAGIDGVPRWADFADPLDAIGMRAADIKARASGRSYHAAPNTRFSPAEREALSILGLAGDTDRSALRRRYSDLVRRYHPDRNGGDRSHEARLQRVIEAYQILRKATAFG